MTWELAAQLIIQIGMPAASYIIAQWQKGGELTAETWAEAHRLANQTALDRANAIVVANHLDPNDPKVKQVLELVSKA